MLDLCIVVSFGIGTNVEWAHQNRSNLYILGLGGRNYTRLGIQGFVSSSGTGVIGSVALGKCLLFGLSFLMCKVE